LQVHPAILELSLRIVRKRGERPILIWRKQQAGLEKGLKAVADAEDQFVSVSKPLKTVAEEVAELHRQNLASGHIVAIGVAAWNDENLIAVQQARHLAQPVDVNAIRMGPGLLER